MNIKGAVNSDMRAVRDTVADLFISALESGDRPQPVVAWGGPGEGKTNGIYDAAEVVKRKIKQEVEVYVNATACLEPTDVAGVPVPVEIDGITRYTSYLPPWWAYKCSTQYEEDQRKHNSDFNAPPALLFFDDIVSAHFQTQTAFFKVVHEGHVGDLRLRDNVMIVAAGNRVDDKAGAHEMPTPLANRFLHLYAKASVKDWIEWAQHKGKIHPYIVAYIRSCNDDLNTFSTEVANDPDPAFATPRSWEMLSKVMKSSRFNFTTMKENDNLSFLRISSGIVGHGVATKFNGFLRNTNAVVPPEVIVKDPHKAEVPSPRNPDTVYATVTALETYLHENPEHWEAGIVYACRDEMSLDHGICLAHTLFYIITNRLPEAERNKAINSDAIMDICDKYDEVSGLINDSK